MNENRQTMLAALLLPLPLIGLGMLLVVMVAIMGWIDLDAESSDDDAAAPATYAVSEDARLIATVNAAPVRPVSAPSISNAESQEVAAAFGYSEEMIASGQTNYQGICAACHGLDARGIVGNGKNLVESEFVHGLDDQALLQFIIVGRTPFDPANTTGMAMPARGGNPGLTDDDIMSIIAYLRVLGGDAPAAAAGGATDTSTTASTEATTDTGSAAAAPTEEFNNSVVAIPGVNTQPEAEAAPTEEFNNSVVAIPGINTPAEPAEAEVVDAPWTPYDVAGLFDALGIEYPVPAPHVDRSGEALYGETCAIRYGTDVVPPQDVCTYVQASIQSGEMDADTLFDLLVTGSPIYSGTTPVHILPRVAYPPFTDAEIRNFIDYLAALES